MAKFNSEQFARALVGRRAVSRYPFPGAEGAECALRLLSDAELDDIRLNAVEYCKMRKVDITIDPEFLDRSIHRYTIFKAFLDPESDPDAPEPFFSSIDDVKSLDSVMVLELFNLYTAHQQSMDPLKYVDEAEVQTLIEALGKPGASEGRLMMFDRRTLLSFVLSMASVLRKMQASPK